eukprot:EG_transcript_4953
MAASSIDLTAARRRSSQKMLFSPRVASLSPRGGAFSPRGSLATRQPLTRTIPIPRAPLPPTLAELTTQELQKARAAFGAKEKAGHGPVRSVQQLRELLLSIGEAPSEPELEKLMQRVGYVDRQVLDWPRFHLLLRLSKAEFLEVQNDHEAETREAFAILGDTPEEEGLPTDQLQSLIEGYGLRLDVKDVARRELRPNLRDDSVLTFDQFSALFGADAIRRYQQEADRAALQRALPNTTLKLRALQKVREMTFRKQVPRAMEESQVSSQRDSTASDDGGEAWTFDLDQVYNQAEDLRRQLDSCVPAFRPDLPRRRKKGPALPHLQGYLERRVEDRLYPFHERPSTRLSALTKQLAEMEESGATKARAPKRAGSSLASAQHYMQDVRCTRHSLPPSSPPEPFSHRSSLLTLDSALFPFLQPPDAGAAPWGGDEAPALRPTSLDRPTTHRSPSPRPLDESFGSSFPPISERSASRAGRAAGHSGSRRGRPPWDARPLNLDAVSAQARHGGRTSPPKLAPVPPSMRPATQEYARQLCLAALLTTDQAEDAAAELEGLRMAHAIGVQAYEDRLLRSQLAG